MTALAGVFGSAIGSSGPVLARMFAEMHARAAGEPGVVEAPGAHLAAARHPWEESLSGWSGPLIASNERWIVAADATIYYQTDLRRQLGLHRAPETTIELLLLALEKWGQRFAGYVEGDYAIVAWERRRERLLLARDFGGRRNLAYAVSGGTVVVASSPTAVVCHPSISSEYDRTFLAMAASANMSHGARTAFRDVACVPGGSTILVEQRRVTEISRWRPPRADSGWHREIAADAASELRALIVDATRERLANVGPTTIWMSGGWDSPSVFAAGKVALLADPSRRGSLHPISVSYPAGDTGNEDHLIREIADHWRSEVRWVHVDQIRLIDDGTQHIREREDPLAQSYASTVRVLARNTIQLDSRVALEGFGGDHLFLISPAAILADHVFYGRWPELWAEWRRRRRRPRVFARSCILPNLSPSVRRWIGTLRGRDLPGYWDRPLMNWIVPTPAIMAELGPEFERQPGEGNAEFEVRLLTENSFIRRVVSCNHLIGLEEGVQPRCPLFDTRVIAFALARPISDRGIGADAKRILRVAMKGLLPDSVLAPRTTKTGTPVDYMRRQLLSTLQPMVRRMFGERQSVLERLGVIDRKTLLSAAADYATGNVHLIGSVLQLTLETERWLTVRESGA